MDLAFSEVNDFYFCFFSVYEPKILESIFWSWTEKAHQTGFTKKIGLNYPKTSQKDLKSIDIEGEQYLILHQYLLSSEDQQRDGVSH